MVGLVCRDTHGCTPRRPASNRTHGKPLLAKASARAGRCPPSLAPGDPPAPCISNTPTLASSPPPSAQVTLPARPPWSLPGLTREDGNWMSRAFLLTIAVCGTACKIRPASSSTAPPAFRFLCPDLEGLVFLWMCGAPSSIPRASPAARDKAHNLRRDNEEAQPGLMFHFCLNWRIAPVQVRTDAPTFREAYSTSNNLHKNAPTWTSFVPCTRLSPGGGPYTPTHRETCRDKLQQRCHGHKLSLIAGKGQAHKGVTTRLHHS